MAALDPAVGRQPQPDEHVAAKALDQAEPFADFAGVRQLDPDRPVGRRFTICSISFRLCSTSRMRIQTRALTSPSSRTGTSNASLS